MQQAFAYAKIPNDSSGLQPTIYRQQTTKAGLNFEEVTPEKVQSQAQLY